MASGNRNVASRVCSAKNISGSILYINKIMKSFFWGKDNALSYYFSACALIILLFLHCLADGWVSGLF